MGSQHTFKIPQGNITTNTGSFTEVGQLGDANLGPEINSGYTTDYEVDEDDPVFYGYGFRICDNDEIPPEDHDLTTFRADQSHWSLNNLPDILYVLIPREQDTAPQQKPSVIEHPFFPNLEIRKFDVLPDQISSKVEGWRVIAWLRMDARIKIRDIVDRMHPRTFDAPGGYSSLDWYLKVLSRVAWRCKQTYNGFNIVRWWNEDHTHLNKVIKLLEDAGIDKSLNTTRGITPGLIYPERGERGGRIPVPSDFHSRWIYVTVQQQLPLPRPARNRIPSFNPPYPPVPGEESDEDDAQGAPGEGYGTTRQRASNGSQLLRDFQSPKNGGPF